jgi:hypothetical protein
MRCPRFGTHSQVRTVRSPKENRQSHKKDDRMYTVSLVMAQLAEIDNVHRSVTNQTCGDRTRRFTPQCVR